MSSVEVCSVVTGKGKGVVVIVIVVTVGDGCGDEVWVMVLIGVDVLGQLAKSVEVGLTKVMRLVMIRGSVTVATLPVDTTNRLNKRHGNVGAKTGKRGAPERIRNYSPSG